MNQVQMVITEHISELVKAIEFKNNNPIFNEDSDDNDSWDKEAEASSEVVLSPKHLWKVQKWGNVLSSTTGTTEQCCCILSQPVLLMYN